MTLPLSEHLSGGQAPGDRVPPPPSPGPAAFLSYCLGSGWAAEGLDLTLLHQPWQWA